MAGIASASMILQLFLLFGQQATTADQVLDRFATAHNPPPRFEANINVSFGNSPPIKSEIKVDGEARCLFTVRWPQGVYKALINKSLIRETVSTDKLYDEHPSRGLSLRGTRLSSAAQIFPDWIRIKDLRAIGKDPKWMLKGYQVRNGIGADRLYLRQEENGAGSIHIVDIDMRGFIVGFDQEQWNPMMRTRYRWDVTDYRPRTSFVVGELDLALPIGYMPYALDYTQGGAEPGGTFPLTGWSRELKIAKTSLLVVYGEDCEASERALPWLHKLESTMPVIYVSDGKPKLVPSALYDPSGKQMEQLDFQATPAMYLLAPDGKILGMWMGYDSARAVAVQKEIVETAAGPDES